MIGTGMQRRTLALVALAALASRSAAVAQGAPAKTKVEEQLLVTGEPGLQYSISPRGQHLGAVVLRGSRQVMVIDGADGPKFDEIPVLPDGSGGKVAWSEDGSRHAYWGRVGQEFVIIVDGKEVRRGPWSTSPGQPALSWLGFTPGGKHWYLILQTTSPGRQHWQLVIDGEPGPVSDSHFTPLWSPDGQHHVYVLNRNPTTGQPPSSALILDGKPAPYQAGEPQFTADGLHLFTKRPVPRTDNIEVLADGKPFMRTVGVELHMAPVGSGVLGVVWTPFVNSARSTFLTVGNRKLPGSDCAATAGIDAVYVSADGKHFAARCPGAWILVDGKKGQEYPGGLSHVTFTADGRAVYQGITNGKTFMIIGDQESEGYASIPEQSARTRAERATVNFRTVPAVISGNKVGYIARASTSDNNFTVVVDGKKVPAVNATNLVFSPDGSRFAFLAGHPYSSATVDGVAFPEMTTDPAIGNVGFQGVFHWSADSKHIAWVAATPTSGVAIDGKFFPAPGATRYLNFTADGRHLIWLVRAAPGHLVFVDGVQVLALPQTLPLENEADIYWGFGEDGTVTFVAQDGGAMKRFRITPGTETNVETLLAKAVKPR